MKGMSNEESGLFPMEHMNRLEKKVSKSKKKLSEMPIPNWSQAIDKIVEIAKKGVKDPAVESIDIRLTKGHVGMNINYVKEGE